MGCKKGHDKQRLRVLIAVIRRKKDLEILLNEKWYRVPVDKLPRRKFGWLAFYQTSALGAEGKLIRYYARVKWYRKFFRCELLPDEKAHPNEKKEYYKFFFSDIKTLYRPIRNTTSMRVTFGFTTLPRLLKFRSLPSLFGVRPLERIFRKMLKKNDIPFIAEYPIRVRSRTRYRLDLAIFCKKGQIDIECDHPKYHSGRHRTYDSRRNAFLRRRRWLVLRLSDEDILFNSNGCISKINQTICRLGGIR